MAKPKDGPRRAVQYLRMSTDRQDLSITLQQDAIGSYAAQRNIEIVDSFEDEARSGLRIANRPAMQRLMTAVTDPRCAFSTILVYDISRWGRFQDTDESAYWDYHCRRHGVDVVYVAEGFPSESTPYSALMKSLKRAMAAEYSRELGVKVRAGMHKLASMGHKMTGVPSLGLVRQVVSKDGIPKMILGPHERKAIQTDRIRLIPGPPEEIDLVRLIFARYAGTRIGLARPRSSSGPLGNPRRGAGDGPRTMLGLGHCRAPMPTGSESAFH
ncbi:MAG: recombinase family protein [Ramlibacter sp.]